MTFKINTKINVVLLSLLFFVFSFLFIILFFQFPQKNEISQKINFKSDFNLIDHNGNNVSIKTFEGKSSAIFFGFTYCPDICPTTLYDMSQVKREIIAAGVGAEALQFKVGDKIEYRTTASGWVAGVITKVNRGSSSRSAG